MRDANAILFDFYDTLGADRVPHGVDELRVLAEFGFTYSVEAIGEALTDTVAFWNGIDPVDHREHSGSREQYIEFQRTTASGWLRRLGVDPYHPGLFERWCAVKDEPQRIRLFDDTLPALTRLQAAGYRLGLVSNWSWDLPQILDAHGLAPLFECVVVSARAGYRKPHAAIYQQALDMLALPAKDVLFVGDSPHADVFGPQAAGMTPIHIDRHGLYEPIPDVTRIENLLTLVEHLSTAAHR
jgi:putative hydrolase of the HAD superfamily